MLEVAPALNSSEKPGKPLPMAGFSGQGQNQGEKTYRIFPL